MTVQACVICMNFHVVVVAAAASLVFIPDWWPLVRPTDDL